jgi:hypothetical protein
VPVVDEEQKERGVALGLETLLFLLPYWLELIFILGERVISQEAKRIEEDDKRIR